MLTEKIEVVHLRAVDGDGPIKAFVDVEISGFLVRGFRVVMGKQGLFVAMPRRQGQDGNWYEIVSPVTEEAREYLTKIILEAYRSESEGGK